MKDTMGVGPAVSGKTAGGTTNVVAFPAGEDRIDEAPGIGESELELAFAMQRETIRTLEWTLGCMNANGGDAQYRVACLLIEETLADLKSITPETTADSAEIANLHMQLKNCAKVLCLSHELICAERPPGP